ncbi:hypothetical protein [Nocardiopsis lucentensis]|uniref:hypothetical protein n=1 Tax=Nocardiopsis lucentensis TaxID=53441 RepID=UPI00187DCA82|nr:hypothetical protein [Nocardiopsis lucentensis]
MMEVVRAAESHLAVTGSRSRDVAYLEVIEKALAVRPTLVHYRLLFGPPRNGALHATDERVRIDTIPLAQGVYDHSVRRLTRCR